MRRVKRLIKNKNILRRRETRRLPIRSKRLTLSLLLQSLNKTKRTKRIRSILRRLKLLRNSQKLAKNKSNLRLLPLLLLKLRMSRKIKITTSLPSILRSQ